MTLKSLLLISIVFTLSLSAQAQDTQKVEAYMFDSFGNNPNGDTKGRLDVFFAQLTELPGSRGVIVVYGDRPYVSSRPRFYKNQVLFRRFDTSRIKYIAGKNVGQRRNEFWVVPKGASDPTFKPEAWISSELGPIGKQIFQREVKRFFETLKANRNDQGFIINYGTPAQIAQREKWISGIDFRWPYEGRRITLVNGGSGTVRTLLWRVPPGAENPSP